MVCLSIPVERQRSVLFLLSQARPLCKYVIFSRAVEKDERDHREIIPTPRTSCQAYVCRSLDSKVLLYWPGMMMLHFARIRCFGTAPPHPPS